MNAPLPAAPLILDPARFDASFDREAFLIGHRLADDPLFRLERLAELAARLPRECVEYNAADIPVGQGASPAPGNGLTVEETIRGIRDCRSWMVLKYVERDPAYRAVLDLCLDQVQPLSERIAPGMARREAFIFVSSPHAVTPYHVDPEYNFLLQLDGTKFMTVWRPNDPLAARHEELERTLAGQSRNLVYRDEYAATGVCHRLEPGQGLHVPVWAPHWVQVGDAISISLSITFRAAPSERRLGVMRVNRRMRALGIEPAPAGEHPLSDTMKYAAFRAARRASALIGRAF